MDDEHRQEMADFLRVRRARLTPEMAGLPAGKRRRTPGLRREEVAELAGISMTWYTWLEQGRTTNMSAQTVENLSRALQLDQAERLYLYTLSQQNVADDETLEKRAPEDSLKTILDALNPNPVYVIDRLWNLVSWNDMADRLYKFSELPLPRRNMLLHILTSQRIKDLWVNWEEDVRDFLAQFRVDHIHTNRGEYADLLGQLQRANPAFQRLWSRHEVRLPSGWLRVLDHPVVGRLEFELTTLERTSGPYFRILIFTAAQGTDTSSKLSRLVNGEG